MLASIDDSVADDADIAAVENTELKNHTLRIRVFPCMHTVSVYTYLSAHMSPSFIGTLPRFKNRLLLPRFYCCAAIAALLLLNVLFRPTLC